MVFDNAESRYRDISTGITSVNLLNFNYHPEIGCKTHEYFKIFTSFIAYDLYDFNLFVYLFSVSLPVHEQIPHSLLKI